MANKDKGGSKSSKVAGTAAGPGEADADRWCLS